MAADGSCDTSIVEGVVDELIAARYLGIIAIKSTVLPGTTQRLFNKYQETYQKYSDEFRDGHLLRLCFVPEFLRERSAFSDFTEHHEVCVVGLPYRSEPMPHWVDYDAQVYKIICDLHGHYPQNFVRLTSTEAELVKYFNNVYRATKIIFANGFYEVCERLGADYTAVKNAVCKQSCIENSYLDCNEQWRGYAGQCLPKEVSAFTKLASDLDVPAEIFRVVRDDNKLYDVTVPSGMRK
jgi:nucleotide sugar dehydrogenase